MLRRRPISWTAAGDGRAVFGAVSLFPSTHTAGALNRRRVEFQQQFTATLKGPSYERKRSGGLHRN